MRTVLIACVALLAGTVLIVGGRAVSREAEEVRPPITTEESAAVVAANNEFALELYAKLRTAQGNIFFSPYSISSALAMTYAGARGQTAEQMAAVMHFGLGQQRLDPARALVMDEVDGAGRAQGSRLNVANALWPQKGYDFLPDFLHLVERHYRARIVQLDFAGATEHARQTINGWVEERTEGKITDIIPPGVLDRLTRLVLTNAIYFKGAWMEPFKEERTSDEPFWLSAEKSVRAPMMNQTERFGYAEFEGCQVLELPYSGRALSMVVLLPREREGLPSLEGALSLNVVNGWLAGLRRREVVVALPRFKLTSQFQLHGVLRAMGMSDAFSLPPADFSGMNGRTDLFISAVIHKAFVDVNEEGTEAAAATAVVVALTAMPEPRNPPVFRADHPFIFLIRHVPTKTILFLGRLTDPTE